MILFQLAFYTDTFGITAAAAGTLFLVVRVWDAVFDPMMGVVADRTNTQLGQVPAVGALDGGAVRHHGLPRVHDAAVRPARASSSTPTSPTSC